MVTPVRRQYLDLKARYPDAILLFRLGDFYETFDDDAKLVARELDIALTSKPMGSGGRAPLAGVPVRSVEQHLARLVGRGHRVAVCEQLEDPRSARGLVRRGVVRVVSPGTALEPSLLEAGESSACCAIDLRRERQTLQIGLASADVSTGAVFLMQLNGAVNEEEALWERVERELARLGAREIVLAEESPAPPGIALALARQPARSFRADQAEREIEAQYRAPSAAFGLEPESPALGAIGGLLSYLRSTQPDASAGVIESVPAAGSHLAHLSAPRWIEAAGRLEWDRATARALALSDRDAASSGAGGVSLLEVLDRCGSGPGRRWLREAIGAPLLEIERIETRLDRVEALVRMPQLRRAVSARLRGFPDLERLLSRAAAAMATPSELARLARGLIEAEQIRLDLESSGAAALAALAERLGPAPEAAARLAQTLAEQPPSDYGMGVILAGVDDAVDAGRSQVERARSRLRELEQTLRDESGIDQLKISYHRSYGYLIDLSRGQAARAPVSWERRQSLRERERFSESRLRARELELTTAEQRFADAEREWVDRMRLELVGQAPTVRRVAGAVARLDAASALASVASERAWSRPLLEPSGRLEIEAGRHPIVEAASAAGGFVPNDTELSDDGLRGAQLLLVTGPNMAGKSTYLRQTALIVILAQAGSFVPAQRARIGLVDRIFARVGAHDELSAGRSTFMVEMLETARLLHGATDRSLVLLDEIGRGTSTWDGLAIAQAVAESLAGGSGSERIERGPRTLFATHFHELTALAGSLSRVANAAVEVAEDEDGEITFLYRVRAGAADRSYGVQVAAMAGLPEAVVERARTLLAQLERQSGAAVQPPPIPIPTPPLRLTPMVDPIVADLAALDVDGLTPLEAISALYALREEARTELRGARMDAASEVGS